jgi:predicted neutral ceramidase superfamily lipid hydrolase
MFIKKQTSRQIPGIISYMEIFQSRKLAYSTFFGIPIGLGLISLMLHNILIDDVDILHFFRFVGLFWLISGIGASFSMIFYSKKAPILRAPPNGWSVQINVYCSVVIELTYLIGQIVAIILQNIWYQEVFLIMGTIISYIVAFVIYFSFTTVGRPGYLILSLLQPIIAIILYSLYTGQFDSDFFMRAIIFFSVCALLFAIPYRRGLFQVSNIYREATGMSGYPFIRAFILSMMTDGNDELIESYFERVGINSNIRIQYLFIRKTSSKELKGLFIVPHVHFGPFKTCGSSDLPEHIYKAFKYIPGTTVYHTTNDHSQNLTSQGYVEIVLNRIKQDIDTVHNNPDISWIKETKDFTRKISNSAKLIGIEVDGIPIIFITRHPLPSDDIESGVGEKIRKYVISKGYKDIIIVDSHNAIIGDEILIKRDSIEAQDLFNVAQNYIESKKVQNSQKVKMLYGVAKDSFNNYSEKEGIGLGGIVVHLFQNALTDQTTALIHFDGNNAYIDIRSYILNMLQNRGIERGEITTSDSHTVARQFSARGYSPIGDKIKINEILEKLDLLIQKAENNLEPVEFYYHDSKEHNVKIWGNPGYFNAIINTLKEAIRVSQSLLTFSLIIPTFFSLIILLFLYNI